MINFRNKKEQILEENESVIPKQGFEDGCSTGLSKNSSKSESGNKKSDEFFEELVSVDFNSLLEDCK